VTILEVRTQASDDDGYETSDGATLNTTEALTPGVTSHSNAALRKFFLARFPGITVAAGSTIDAAYIELKQGGSGDDMHGDIVANDVDDAANLTDEADVVSRVRTTATVAWNADNVGTDAVIQSPEIKTVVQEVIDRAGWASGQALAIIIDGHTSPTAVFRIRTFDQAAGTAPLLHIEYTEGGAGGDPEGPMVGGKLVGGGLLIKGRLVG